LILASKAASRISMFIAGSLRPGEDGLLGIAADGP